MIDRKQCKKHKKYLVIRECNFAPFDQTIFTSFDTRQEAVDALNKCFTKTGKNRWDDGFDHSFFIQNNYKEYVRA